MIDRTHALEVAHEWVDAWNAHDPERVVSHFSDDVVVHSPLAERLRPGSNGTLAGKDAVLSYYRDGLAANPDLEFSLVEVCTGIDEMTIVYRNQRQTLATEALKLRDNGTVAEVRVGYGG